MLYKENYKNKLFYLSILFILFSIYFNFENYIGNKTLFLIFNLSALGLFLTIIRKNVSAFEFFFAFFLLLSFWFKFSCILYFDKIKVVEGNFDLDISNYDKSTIVIIFSFIGFIIGSFLRELISNTFLNNKNFKARSYFLSFYKKYRSNILFLFIFSLFIFCMINFYYKIYNRGQVNENVPILVKYFFSWAFTYGLAVTTSILIYVDFFIFKNKKYFFLGIFEAVLSNISIFSRGFLISIFAYLRGFFFLINFKKKKISTISIFKIIFSTAILLSLAFYTVTQLRNLNFVKTEFYQPKSIETTVSELLSLSVNRWVGIDALLSVSQNENISFEFFKSSLSEKKQFRKGSFYIDNFYQNFENTEKENFNVVITPGLIPFLYYTGSVIFVFISMIIIIIFCSLIEKIFFLFSAKNEILINVIGYAMAVRVTHFGYLPYNTFNYLLSLLITLFFVYILSLVIWKKF